MTDPELGMDALITRLKDQAALVDAQDSLAIKSWLTLWQARLVPIFDEQCHRLYEPQVPRLAELLSGHLDDEHFVERAYRFLVGRSSDQQGAIYYRQLAAREGRITTLVSLLQSNEAKTYIKQQQLQLPGSLLRLERGYRWLVALPGVRRAGHRAWRGFAGWLWRYYQPRWREQAEYYSILAHYGQRQKEHQALAMTLAEMADIQQRIVAQLTAESRAPSSPPVKWLSVDQAAAMAEMLKHAEEALSRKEKETL